MDVSETSPGATAPDSFFIDDLTTAAALVGTNQQSFVSICI